MRDAKTCHQRAHRLSLEKKEVLQYQLDELLRQGIIAPVSDTENIPITSPVVLVSKSQRKLPKGTSLSKEDALRSFRFCCDFRYLNSQMEEFRYTIPDLEELTESLTARVPNYLTSIDLSSGFFQMGISPESTSYTAFNTCFGTYKFLRLPMGLRTSPNTFQLLMDKVLHGLTFQAALCYLDDVLICSETFEQHIADLEEVFRRFRNAGLKLGPRKCKFAQPELVFLGHLVSKAGISPPPDRVDAISKYPPPSDVKSLRRFLGMIGWFRKFIPKFSVVAEPLHFLLKKQVPFQWTYVQQSAFEELKNLLITSPVLAFPRFDRQFRLAVDTSSKGIGYMLYQYHDSEEASASTPTPHVVRFGSKSLSKWQRSYGPTKLELLGMTTAIMDCASYLRGNVFVVECDHQALRPLFQRKLKGAIYERWLTILQQFNFDIQYKPASQMVVADALSRCLLNNAEDNIESPDMEDPHFPYVPEASGCIRLPDGQQLDQLLRDSASDCNTGCNNATDKDNHRVQSITFAPLPLRLDSDIDCGYDADTDEYSVQCKRSRMKCHRSHVSRHDDFHPYISSKHNSRDMDPQIMDMLPPTKCVIDSSALPVRTDNQDVYDVENEEHVQQTNTYSDTFGDSTEELTEKQKSVFENTTDDDTAVEYNGSVFEKTTELDSCITSEEFTQPSDNSLVTDSTCHSSDKPNKDNLQQTLDLISKTNMSAQQIAELQLLDSGLQPMITYLNDGTLPKSQKLARRVLLEASDYILVDGLLMHSRIPRSRRAKHLNPYQLVLPEALYQTVLDLYHNSPLGCHGGIQDTLDRIKEHYFFRCMSMIIPDYVRSCDKCQKRKVTQRHTKNGISAFPTPSAPFQVLEADLFGPLPMTNKGYVYILTAVDMYSKFLIAIPLAGKDALSVATSLYHIFTLYGVCETLITDRGTEFTAQVTQIVGKLLGFQHQFTPPYAHHCLGACERTHATLAERISTQLGKDPRVWDEYLPGTVFAMNSAVNSGTGFSPYEIVFGCRPRFPLAPSSSSYQLTSVPEDHKTYLDNLSKRLNTIRQEMEETVAKSKAGMLNRANTKVKELKLQKGDYVYLSHDSVGPGKKLKYKYDGPLVIHEVCSDHTFRLIHPVSGKVHDSLVHVDRLKLAYVREPNPVPYFLGKVTTKLDIQCCDVSTQTHTVPGKDTVDNSVIDSHVLPLNNIPSARDNHVHLPPLVRPTRQRRKPRKYCSTDHVSSISSADSSCVDSGFYKIKKIIGQRKQHGKVEYLVHFVGEPSQNAMWLPYEDLNIKAQKAIRQREPPFLQ